MPNIQNNKQSRGPDPRSGGSFLKHMRHDLRRGLCAQWVKYVVAALIFATMCGLLYTGHQNRLVDQTLSGEPVSIEKNVSFGDYLFYSFRGVEEFIPGSENFEINPFWILTNVFLAFIVCLYPLKDLAGYGKQMLLRSQKRSYWWLSKCIWNIACVLAFYLTAYGVAVVFAAVSGNFSIFPQAGVQAALSFVGIAENLSAGEYLLYMIALPVLVSIALSLLEMAIALMTKPVFGIIAICAVLSASLFWLSDWLPGNHLMMMRTRLVLPEYGVTAAAGIAAALLLSAVSVLAGYIYFKHKDILS